MSQGQPPEQESMTLATAATRYWEHHGRHVVGAGVQKRNLYLATERVGTILVDEFTLGLQENLIRELRAQGYANGTIKRILGTLKAAVSLAWKRGEVRRMIPFVSVQDNASRERILEVAELAALWDAAEQLHLREFIMVMLTTAARPKAALELTRFQCDVKRRRIDLNPAGREQTRKRRPVVPLVEPLIPWVEASEVHLVTFHGKPVGKISKAWRSARARAGLSEDVVPYSIRHTVATHMRREGVPPLEIASYLGHRMPDFRTTERYAKHDPSYLIRAAEAVTGLIKAMGQTATYPIIPETVRASCVLAAKSPGRLNPCNIGAGDEIRTHNPNLGKVVLYP